MENKSEAALKGEAEPSLLAWRSAFAGMALSSLVLYICAALSLLAVSFLGSARALGTETWWGRLMAVMALYASFGLAFSTLAPLFLCLTLAAFGAERFRFLGFAGRACLALFGCIPALVSILGLTLMRP